VVELESILAPYGGFHMVALRSARAENRVGWAMAYKPLRSDKPDVRALRGYGYALYLWYAVRRTTVNLRAMDTVELPSNGNGN
jgi:hypothetical protein